MLWHDTMQVLLTPEKVDYRIYAPLVRKASAVGSVHCASDGAAHLWTAAGEALRAALVAEGPRRLRLEILLSDRFVHYQVLPWRGGIATRAEWRAYARHAFETVHGEMARHWDMRIDVVPPGRESLACAIETALIDTLRGIAQQNHARIVSIRPNFIANFGQRRGGLRGAQFWFAVVQPRHVCLGAFRQGYWVGMRNEPAAEGWRAALPGMLRRTQCTLAEPCDGDLYLCGDIAEEVEPFFIDATTVRLLPSGPRQRPDASQGAGAISA